ncbi:MAG: transcription elongation factor GreA [Bacillales bacterium]|nr:transcription elongation factor GreA [Bacillales bacterium]
MEKIIVTQEGYEQLQTELRHLIDVVKPEIIQELKEARAQGDLSENADYDAARQKQAEVEAKIAELTEKIENAQIISTSSKKSNEVKIGSYVLIRLSYNNKEEEYHIVGSTEANPKALKISNECALAKAILGHTVGETVSVKAVKPYSVTILSCSAEPNKN